MLFGGLEGFLHEIAGLQRLQPQEERASAFIHRRRLVAGFQVEPRGQPMLSLSQRQLRRLHGPANRVFARNRRQPLIGAHGLFARAQLERPLAQLRPLGWLPGTREQLAQLEAQPGLALAARRTAFRPAIGLAFLDAIPQQLRVSPVLRLPVLQHLRHRPPRGLRVAHGQVPLGQPEAKPEMARHGADHGAREGQADGVHPIRLGHLAPERLLRKQNDQDRQDRRHQEPNAPGREDLVAMRLAPSADRRW